MSTPPASEVGDGEDGEDLAAAEYALGVLDPAARAAVEARSEADPTFAGEIFAWVLRFAPLMELVTPVEPSPALWGRIQASIARSDERRATAAPVAGQPPETPPEPANDRAPRGVGLWRAWAVGASAVAAAALLFIGVRALSPSALSPLATGGHTLVARLLLKDGGGGVVTVAYDPQRAVFYMAPDADFSVPAARSAELWLIPADGKPRPLGVMDPSKPASLSIPASYRTLARPDAVLALSIEPPGGSPTGAPTGPVIAGGDLRLI
jgi:anti-sigma-K factor RskA